MAASVVQTRTNSDFSGSGTSMATSSGFTTVAAGDAIVVVFTHDNSGGNNPTLTCADSAGNTYTAALDTVTDTNDTQKMTMFIAVNCGAGSSVVVTVTGTGGSAMVGRGIHAMQVTGVVSTAVVAGQHKSQWEALPTTVADAADSTNVTPTNAGNNILLGFSFNSHGAAANAPVASLSATDQGTFWSIPNGGNAKARCQSKIVVGTSGVAAQFTAGSNEDHITFGMALAESGAGAVSDVLMSAAERVRRNTLLRL